MQHAIEVKKLSAMAHESRLSLLKFLISRGPTGAFAGDIAEHAGLAASTTSVQLTVLVNANLIEAQREGRHIRYRADFVGIKSLLTYLMADCCGGHSDLCPPLSLFSQSS